MFSKAFFASALVVAFSVQAHAHAGISPALGVNKAQLARSDVQRPSAAQPCGNVNIAQKLDSSTPVNAAADGSFTATVTDFNPSVAFAHTPFCCLLHLTFSSWPVARMALVKYPHRLTLQATARSSFLPKSPRMAKLYVQSRLMFSNLCILTVPLVFVCRHQQRQALRK
jgi:hypothetical protein